MSPDDLRPLYLFLHVASAVVWVGGMFFAYVCLRPVAARTLDAPSRLKLWRQVLQRFFAWVWVSVALIPASGIAMLSGTAFVSTPRNWRVMMALGIAMILIYLFVVLSPFQALRRAVDREDWKGGGEALGRIRRWVGVNLLLGVITVAMATLGRWFA